MVKAFEGLRLDAYPDPATGGDPWTIGYGDTGPDVVPGMRITRADAEARLLRRLNDDFGQNVNEEIGDAPTTQAQFDAMTSLAYNIGNGGAAHQHGHRGFDGSSVLRLHLAGDYEAAGDAFLLWNKGGNPLHVIPALTRRREAERAWYLSDLPGTPRMGSPSRSDRDPMAVADATKALQTALVPYGYAGLIDGDPGPQTLRAIAEYRRST
jgi:lysozyme